MNDTQNPQSQDAAAALERAESSSAALRKHTIGVRVAMACFALASAIAMLMFGFVPLPGGIIGGTFFAVGAAVSLSIVGVTARARSRDFTRRYLIAIFSWAIIYVAALLVGWVAFEQAPAVVWIIGAVLVAVPGAWFAITSSGKAVK
ncbi:hypothetical protein [Microbacterium sp. MPKO10]|uniref:hypothetical protein n=1 Tax=Microbacterium sp. MPKO10 TaxID=2989818 RepID=UPI002235C81B|nr:hypothetical protein [Microbacterium sp. MPKO10]MCW4457264.1 hypothetical protein [Microbacterium sp. MPKO10]